MACGSTDGGGEGEGEGDFFEDIFDDDELFDGGDDADAGEGEGEGEGEGSIIEPVADAIRAMADGEELLFTGASGRWRSDVNGSIVGGARLLEVGAESLAVRFDGAGAGAYTCGTDALLSYNARDEQGAPLLYSSRPEGAACTVVVETYGDMGQRIQGYFDATLMDAAGAPFPMAGAFDVERLDDQ